MEREDGVPAVEVSTRVSAGPESVFRFFTDSNRCSEWLGAEVSLIPEIGGALRVDFARHGTVVAGEVREIVPGKKLVFTWGVESGPQSKSMPAGSTIVEVTLEPDGEGTLVTLRHSDLPNENERKDHEEGWREYLETLAQVAGSGGDPERIG